MMTQNNNPRMLAGEQHSIQDLWYIPLTKQPPLFMRPYNLVTSGNTAGVIGERMVNNSTTQRGANSGGILTPSLVSDITSQILKPSTMAYDSVIDTMWMNQSRYIFILKVASFGLGGQTNTYIQGYTDYDGISDRGMGQAYADPNMNHSISSVIETAVVELHTPMGIDRSEKLSRVYDVLKHNNTSRGIDMLRPTDVIDGVNINLMKGYVEDAYGNNTMGSIVTSAGSKLGQFSDRVETSKIDNNIGSLWFTNTINEGIKQRSIDSASFDSEMSFDNGYSDYAESEALITKNRFLAMLAHVSGDMNFKGNFSYNDLLKIDQVGANNFTLGNVKSENVMLALNNTPMLGGGEYWNGQDQATITAHSLLQSGMSIAAKFGFSFVQFEMNSKNTIFFDHTCVAIVDQSPYINVDMAGYQYLLEGMRERFFREVFAPETHNGTFPIKATLYIDILGDSKIYLEYGFDNGTWYTLPTVAKSHIVPVISTDPMSYQQTVGTFGSFLDDINDILVSNKNTFL